MSVFLQEQRRLPSDLLETSVDPQPEAAQATSQQVMLTQNVNLCILKTQIFNCYVLQKSTLLIYTAKLDLSNPIFLKKVFLKLYVI